MKSLIYLNKYTTHVAGSAVKIGKPVKEMVLKTGGSKSFALEGSSATTSSLSGPFNVIKKIVR